MLITITDKLGTSTEKMSKIKYLIIIHFLFLSCQNQEKKSLINKSIQQRKRNGLNIFSENLKLDSTLILKSNENDWNVINYLATYEELKLDKNKKTSNFGIIDFYSNTNKNQFKIIYYVNNKDVLKLVSEEDRFYRKLNDTIEIYLGHKYNYLKKESTYSIDSLPTKYFVEKNQKKLKEMHEYAKKNNLEICGTAANEILRKGFPKSYTEINFTKFNKVKTELK
jgi:hypothetical protein